MELQNKPHKDCSRLKDHICLVCLEEDIPCDDFAGLELLQLFRELLWVGLRVWGGYKGIIGHMLGFYWDNGKRKMETM